jgi:phosphoglycerate dehydrogenase-like enzyme
MSVNKVVCFNVAPEDIYTVLREELPAGFELITLESEDEQEVLEKVKDADYILVANMKITDRILQGAPKVKLIQHWGVGYNNIDVFAAKQRGIPVGLTPEGTSVAVAEHVLLLILSVYRKLVYVHNSLVNGKWLQWDLRTTTFNLHGKRLGLIGCGRIGQEVAKRVHAFGATMKFYDKYQTNDIPYLQPATFEEILTESDIISLHLPLNHETRELIGEAELEKMKPSAIVINTSRGPVVDERALYQALRNRTIAGAGIDVFEEEPTPPNNPLLTLDNVVVTPHLAAGTVDALREKMRAAFRNMERVSQGETPINIVSVE